MQISQTIMKNFSIISTACLLLFVSNIKAQDVAPLQLGNIWVYNVEPEGTNNLWKTTVIDTNIIIDSIVYYKLETISDYGGDLWYGYRRLNEDGYYVYPLNDTLEFMYYKKNTIIGDTWENPNPEFPEYPAVYTVLDTFVAPVFGSSQIVKYLSRDYGILLFYEYWTEKFGKLSNIEHPYGWATEVLMGCVKDGVAYGDTSFRIVSVGDEFLPNKFVLTQNFPNPFNPSTQINFTLPEGDFVTLEVFNVLGEKIKSLISEFKPAGKHTVQFEANELASGTYLYVLKTTNFIQTKKMQLVK